MYRFGFKRYLLGYGSAVALVMLVICLGFSVAYMRLARQEEY
jgi:raffinose/stachyose/melibiose transport system permease protein